MDFTVIVPSVAGGILIGLAAAALLLSNGRIAGISGILAGLLAPRAGEVAWRVLFVAGLVCGGVLLPALATDPFRGLDVAGPARLVVAGLLVGFGARRANGCTSGHGVCGVGRMSPRSVVATITFMTTGAMTVFVARHLLGVLP